MWYCIKFVLILFMVSSFNSSISGQAKKNVNRGFIVELGQKAPDFEYELIDGTKGRLADLKGKVVLLQFTASWCSVCIKEMPHLENEIWQIHKDKEFVLIGIDRDEELEIVQKFIDKIDVSYPISLDPGGEIFNLFAQRGSGVTRNVLIDAEGNIVFLTRLYDPEEFALLKSAIRKQVD
jgi:peroxiredoxin